MVMKRIVTIGGSDSSGGAGIQADIKTFSALGVYGTSVITAVTAQNSKGVQDKLEIPVELVNSQIESIIGDIGVDYAKTGMLSSSTVIMAVAARLKEYAVPFVLDPVMKAGSGGTLIDSAAVDTLVKHLLPLCRVVTPNIMEASTISGLEIKTLSDMKEAAIAIHEKGAPAVIITGGHLECETGADRATDLVYDGDGFKELTLEYIELRPGPAQGTTKAKAKAKSKVKVLHGSGCSFSAALAVGLAKGYDLSAAAVKAKAFVHDSIIASDTISNYMVVNPARRMRIDADRYRVLENLREAVGLLKRTRGFKEVIPEVGTNIGMAIEGATGIEDIAAVDGRIHPTHEGIHLGCIEFGVSSHIARMILTMMKYEPDKRSAINIKYTPELVSACENAGLRLAYFERDKEPMGVETMVWGIEEALKQGSRSRGKGRAPDVIFDRGAYGKEAMIRIFDTTAVGVVKRLRRLLS